MRNSFLRPMFLAVLLYAATAPASAAEIAPYAAGSFAALVREHAGRPLVVHFWSMTCAPCLAELPRLARLQNEQPDFDLVLVATDSLADRARLAARLDKAQLADRRTYAFADSFTERLYFEADRNWRGELPFTVRIDRHGERQAAAGPIDANDLREWLMRQE